MSGELLNSLYTITSIYLIQMADEMRQFAEKKEIQFLNEQHKNFIVNWKCDHCFYFNLKLFVLLFHAFTYKTIVCVVIFLF